MIARHGNKQMEAPPRPIVYISSPYTHGDQSVNVRFQLETWDRLLSDGLVWPVAPLWSHFQHLFRPRSWQDWITYDLALIPRYDACLRLPVEYEPLDYEVHLSAGADQEEALFRKLGKPVFASIPDCYDWARSIQEASR